MTADRAILRRLPLRLFGLIALVFLGCVAVSRPVKAICTFTGSFDAASFRVNAQTASINMSSTPYGTGCTYQARVCFGDGTQCPATPYDATKWYDMTEITSPGLFTSEIYTGLKENRVYEAMTFSFFDTSSGNSRFSTPVVVGSSATWPGDPPSTYSVTDMKYLPAGPGVTEGWSATINWAAKMPGIGYLTYGLSTPEWSTNTSVTAAGDYFRQISGLSTGQAWGATFGGSIYSWQSGSWSSARYSSGGTALQAIDVQGQNYMAAVGNGGLIVASTDGVNWSRLTPSISVSANLYAVNVPHPNDIWFGGAGEEIYHYRNGITTRVTPSDNIGTQSIFSITAVNSREVWAVGTSGRAYHTTNGGSNWSWVQLDGADGGNYVNTIVTLDGKRIWAGGRNGLLWLSNDSGVNWSKTQLADRSSIEQISLLSVDKAMFIQGKRIGTIIATVTGPSAPSYDDSLSSVPSNLDAFTIVNPVHLLTSCSSTTYHYWQYGSFVVDGVNGSAHQITLSGLNNFGAPYYFSAETWANGSGGRTGIFGTFTLPTPDTTNPQISITDPSGSTLTTRTSPYTVRGAASDNQAGDLGLSAVVLQNSGAAQTVTTVPNIDTTPAAVSWSSAVTLNPGNNTITATATDTSGNVSSAAKTIVYDNQSPVITITNPTSGATVNSQPVNLTGTTTDNDQVVSMDYQLNGATATAITRPATGYGTWTVQVSGLVSGNNTITVHAFDVAGNVGSATVVFNYAEPTFSVSIAPSANQTVDIGQNILYTITLTPQYGFTGNVALSANNPGGVTTQFTPATVAVPGGTSTLSVNTSAGTAGGPYTLTVTGQSGSRTASASVQFSLRTAPSFTMSVAPNPPAPDVIAGDSGSYTIALSANTTFSGTVTMTIASGLPTGADYDISPTDVSLTAGGTVSTIILTVNTATTTPTGSYNLVLQGSGSGVTRSQNIPLNVTPAPNFTLTLAPGSQNVTAGGAASFYIANLVSQSGFTGLVDLSATPPAGMTDITTTLSRSQVQLNDGGSASVVINAKAANSVAGGTYVITVTARRGTIEHSQPVNLIVAADVTRPTISNIQAAPNWDRVTISWDTDELTDARVRIIRPTDLVVLVDQSDEVFCTSLPCNHSMVITPLIAGTTYYYEVVSRDTSPARNFTSVTTNTGGDRLQFATLTEPDLINPSVIVSNPAASTPPPTVIGTIAITGSASDNKSVQRVNISVKSVPSSLWPAGYNTDVACTGETCDFAGAWTTNSTVPNGDYEITVTAIDTAGNVSTPVVRPVYLQNDFTAPQILSGPDVEVAESCDLGDCWATIRWTTDDQSTSQVDYGITITSCDPGTNVCTYPSQVRSDDKSSGNPAKLYNIHEVTLRNLTPKSVYHFRIASCNGNNQCTN